MASVVGHVAAAGAIYALSYRKFFTPSVLIFGLLCSVVPDFDVLAFNLNIPYEHPLGHRGFTHSILFAILLAFLLVFYHRKRNQREKVYLFFFYFLCTMSHGILDAMTSGGRGVGFFIPLVNERYFFPWREIKVSSLRLSRFFGEHGRRVLMSEWKYIIKPSLIIILLVFLIRKTKAFYFAKKK